MKVTDASSGSGKWYYYEKNLQGDIVGIMNADGYKVVSYSYDAWGVPYAPVFSTDSVVSAADKANAELNPFRYRGYYYDSETGYYYLQTRYYNPEWGRFINADSALYSNMLGFNMFVYCYNNPVNCIDPTGENGFSEALAGWASSACGLTLVAGPLPIGDIVYWGGCAILGIFAVAETIALADTISNTIQDEADVDSDIEDETYEHSLPTEGEPNSERELRDKDGVKQKRHYGPDGKADYDIDYRHPDPKNTHEFPHRHNWDWNKKPPRSAPIKMY